MPRMKADQNLFYHRSTYQKGEEFEVLDNDVKALEDQNLAHVVKVEKTKEPQPQEPTSTPDPDKPVSKMNRTELEAYAEKVGVEGPFDQYKNMDELRAAVEKAESSK